jgi:SNF2 family DNA or RNA helicase
MYKLKKFIDAGLNISNLPSEVRDDAELIITLSSNFTTEDASAKEIDELLYQLIMNEYPEFVPASAEPEAVAQPESVIAEPAKVNIKIEESEKLIGDGYFKAFPDKVLGEQFLGGRFGSTVQVKGGIEAIDVIEAPPVTKTFTEFDYDVPLSTRPEDEIIAEVAKKFIEKKDDKRFKIGKKSKPKATEGTFTFREIYDQYNEHISRAELEAFLYGNSMYKWEKFIDDFTFTKEQLVKDGLLFYSGGKLIYRYQYIAGNIREKQMRLEKDREDIVSTYGVEIFENQQAELKGAEPEKKTLLQAAPELQIQLLPKAEMSRTFKIKQVNFRTEPYSDDGETLYASFYEYCREYLKASDFGIARKDDVLYKYLAIETYRRRKDKKTKEEDEANENYRYSAAKQVADELFIKFIREELTWEDQMRLDTIWNEKYNNWKSVVYDKIPVGFTANKRFKYGDSFAMRSVQRESNAFYSYIRSGCFALEVGLGKTMAAISSISTSIEHGWSKYPLIIVPNMIYSDWIKNIQGDDNALLGHYSGMLEHYPAVRALNNCGSAYVYDYKIYSKEEEAMFDDIQAEILLFKEYALAAKKGEKKEINENHLSPDYKYYRDVIIPTLNTISGIDIQVYNNENSFAKGGKIYSSKAQLFYETAIATFNKFLNLQIYDKGEWKEMPEGTITVITWEGLRLLGVRDPDILVEEILNIIEQGDTPKDEAKIRQRVSKSIYAALGNPKIYLDDLGIDMIVLDEAHRAKNIFATVKARSKKNDEGEEKKDDDGKVQREKNNYEITSTVSQTGIAAYCMVTYIRKINDNKNNVILLTGTPFENNPLEVYSMLSLANHTILTEMGYGNIIDFFDTFLKINYELVVSIKGQIGYKQVLLGFNNTKQLRDVIYNVILYRTGDETKIPRPDKIILPKDSITTPDNTTLNIKTLLAATDVQKEVLAYIEDWVTSKDSNYSIDMMCGRASQMFDIIEQAEKTDWVDEAEEGDEVAEELAEKVVQLDPNRIDNIILKEGIKALTGLAQTMNVSISPYLFNCFLSRHIIPTVKYFVEHSAKIQYVIECIKGIKEYHEKTNTPMSGIIIYMNRGSQFFHAIQEYLINPKFGIGFKENEIAILSSNYINYKTGKPSGMTIQKKERIKADFNSGVIKVLIGTKTMREGVDLQHNASTMFICALDWNPTDSMQVIGRIHRFGNRFSNVRIVYPLLENSADSIIYQKLFEKTSRLKEIWDRENSKSQLDLQDFDPNELKMIAITNPRKKAAVKIEIEKRKLEAQLNVYNSIYDELYGFRTSKNNVYRRLDYVAKNFPEYYSAKMQIETKKINKELSEKIEPYENTLADLVRPINEKNQQIDNIINKYADSITEVDNTIAQLETELETKVTVLKNELMEVGIGDYDTEKEKANAEKRETEIKAEIRKLKNDFVKTRTSELVKEKDVIIKTRDKESEKLVKERDKLVEVSEQKKVRLNDQIDKLRLKYNNDIERVKTMYNDYILAIRGEKYPENFEYNDAIPDSQRLTMANILSKKVYRELKDIPYDERNLIDDYLSNTECYSLTQSAKEYTAAFIDYVKLVQKYIIPLNIKSNDIDELMKVYTDKIKEMNQQIANMDSMFQHYVDQFTAELALMYEDMKPHERATEFGTTNFLLDDYFDDGSFVVDTKDYSEDIKIVMDKISEAMISAGKDDQAILKKYYKSLKTAAEVGVTKFAQGGEIDEDNVYQSEKEWITEIYHSGNMDNVIASLKYHKHLIDPETKALIEKTGYDPKQSELILIDRGYIEHEEQFYHPKDEEFAEGGNIENIPKLELYESGDEVEVFGKCPKCTSLVFYGTVDAGTTSELKYHCPVCHAEGNVTVTTKELETAKVMTLNKNYDIAIEIAKTIETGCYRRASAQADMPFYGANLRGIGNIVIWKTDDDSMAQKKHDGKLEISNNYYYYKNFSTK